MDCATMLAVCECWTCVPVMQLRDRKVIESCLPLVVIALASLGLHIVGAAPPDGPTPDELLSMNSVGDVVVSPDGSQIAYMLGRAVGPARRRPEIHIVHVDGSGDSKLTDGSSPAWSPDGRTIAFFSSRSGSKQVWLINAEGSEAHPLTNHDGFIDRFRWAPDGSLIAFLARRREVVDLRFFTRQWQEGRPTIVDENNLPTNRLWLVDVKTGDERPLTEDTYSAGGYEQWFPDTFSWSPDSKRIAFSKRPDAKAGSHLLGEIAVIDVAHGKVEVLTDRPGMDGYPLWSPDGRSIAFISTDRHDWVTVSYLYQLDVETRKLEKLSPDFDEKIKEFFWVDGGQRILFIAGKGVSTQIFSLDIEAKATKQLTSAMDVYSGLDVAADGFSITFIRQIVGWKSFDGIEIEGLVHKPTGYREGQRYPLLVVPHGGPHSVMTNGFVSGDYRLFAQGGWVVFRPNFRGSGHYGEKFLRANLGGWGLGDYQDVMTGVDHLIERGLVDENRMAISGSSYGGYMTSWTISQTNRFKAAVVGAAITDVPSFVRTTDVPERFEDYLGKDQKNYHRSSPMYYADNIRTPTLIWHGDGDIRVPLMQGRHLYTALKQKGVPTEFVIYHGEAHGIRNPEHQRDLLARK